MDLKKYVEEATRTESRIDSININPKLLLNTIKLFIAGGTVLDMIKKKVFYDKPFDKEEYRKQWLNAYEALRYLEFIPLDQHDQFFVEEKFPINPRIFHAIIGIATESTELMEAMIKKDVDLINILEEIGDVNWYAAIMIDALGGDFEQILATNIEKLKKRFPDKFTTDKAKNRDLDAEREILDKQTIS